MRRYFGRLLDILKSPLPVVEGSRNELVPRQLPLSPEAKSIWIAFHDHISTLCGQGKELHPIKGLAAKGAEHAARLAGVLTLVHDLDAGSVAAAEMEAGIELTQFYLAEGLRLFDALADNPDLLLAEQCLAWARTRTCPLTLPDLYQLGPNRVRDKETAKKIVGILESHGWLRQMLDGAEVSGREVAAVGLGGQAVSAFPFPKFQVKRDTAAKVAKVAKPANSAETEAVGNQAVTNTQAAKVAKVAKVGSTVSRVPTLSQPYRHHRQQACSGLYGGHGGIHSKQASHAPSSGGVSLR